MTKQELSKWSSKGVSRSVLARNLDSFAGDMTQAPLVTAHAIVQGVTAEYKGTRIAVPLDRKPTSVTSLNKLESAYLQLLQARKLPWIGIQCIKLSMADNTTYRCDFWTIGPNGQLEGREVKGFMRDDAWVKLKTVARQYPFLVFYLVKRVKGQWVETEVNP